MSHPNLKIPLRVAIGIILLRLLLFYVNADFPYQEEGYFFLTLTAIPVLVIYAIWPRGQVSDFLKSLALGMRFAMLYGLIIAVFTFLFYTFMDKTYFPNMRDGIVAAQLEALEGSEDPEVVRQKINDFFSVRNFAVLYLLLFLVLAAFYSFTFGALKHLLLRSKTA